MLKCLIRGHAHRNDDQLWPWLRKIIFSLLVNGTMKLSPLAQDIVSVRAVVKLSSATLSFRWNNWIFQYKSPMCIGIQFSNGVLGESAFTLNWRWQSVGSGGFLAPSSTPSSAAASAETTSCWGSPFLGEACWPPHRQQTLLSPSALGGDPDPQVPCWDKGRQSTVMKCQHSQVTYAVLQSF